MSEGVKTTLQGKRIIITGGTSGIGLAIAMRLLEEGVSHLIVSSELETPPDWEVFDQSGTTTSYLKCDTGSKQEPTELIKKARELMGGIDGMVHCAGVYLESDPGDRTPLQLWEESVNIKARGGYLLANTFAETANDGASFVGVTSINADQSEPDHLAYDSACAAFSGVIRSFAVQHAPRLRFNALAPGLIQTRITEEVTRDSTLHAHAVSNIPMGRVGDPRDCAGAAVFLLGDDSSYVTGITLYVDGGISANQMSKPS